MLLAAIGYGLVAMFAGGISNALLKDSVTRFGPRESAALRAAVSSAVLLVLIILTRPTIPWDLGMLGFTLAVSLLGYFPFLFMLEGFRGGKVGAVVPVSSGWVVIAAAVGYAFFDEAYPPLKIAALALVIFGVFAASFNPTDWRAIHPLSPRSGIPFALAAALLWGVVFPLFKVTSEFYGALVFAFIIETTVSVTACLHLAATGNRVFPPLSKIRRGWLPFTIAGFLTAFYTMAVSAGYQTGEIGIVSALAGSGVVVAVIVAAVLHHERLHAAQYAGAGLVLLGTALASMMGSP